MATAILYIKADGRSHVFINHLHPMTAVYINTTIVLVTVLVIANDNMN